MYCLSALGGAGGAGADRSGHGLRDQPEALRRLQGLLDYGFANYAPLYAGLPGGRRAGEVGDGGKRGEAVPGSETPMLIESRKAGMTTEVTLEESITAPVSQGQRLGELTVLEGGEVITRIPLIAKTTIPRLTFGEFTGPSSNSPARQVGKNQKHSRRGVRLPAW